MGARWHSPPSQPKPAIFLKRPNLRARLRADLFLSIFSKLKSRAFVANLGPFVLKIFWGSAPDPLEGQSNFPRLGTAPPPQAQKPSYGRGCYCNCRYSALTNQGKRWIWPRGAPNNLVISLPLPNGIILPLHNMQIRYATVRKTGTSNDEAFFATFQGPQFGLATPYQKQNAKSNNVHTKYCFRSYKNHINIYNFSLLLFLNWIIEPNCSWSYFQVPCTPLMRASSCY